MIDVACEIVRALSAELHINAGVDLGTAGANK